MGVTIGSKLSTPLGGSLKRSFDIVVSGMLLLALAPLMLVIAVLSKILQSGPVLYFHRRVGYGGKLFACWKFRSMYENADEILRDFFRDHPAEHREWIITRKLKRDPRVSLLGHVLRETSLDELPQLFNVFIGDMSCVGPRPITPEELELYGPKQHLYLSTRPGLTGAWQVSGRNDLSYEERVLLDSEYVQSWNVARDVSILAKTVPAVVTRRGCY